MACSSCGCACQIVLAGNAPLPGNGNPGTPYTIDLTDLIDFPDGCGYHWTPVVNSGVVSWSLALDFDPVMFACTGGGAGITSLKLSARAKNYAQRVTTAGEEGLYVAPPIIRGFGGAVIASNDDGSVSVPVTVLAAGANVTVTPATVGNQTTWTISSSGSGGGGSGALDIIDDTGGLTGHIDAFGCITHSDSIHWVVDEFGCLKGSGTAPVDELTIKTISGLLSVDLDVTIASYGAGGAITPPKVGDLYLGYDPVVGASRLNRLTDVFGKIVGGATFSAGAAVTHTGGGALTGSANTMVAIGSVRAASWLNNIGVPVKGRWHIRSTSAWLVQCLATGTGFTPDVLGVVRVLEMRDRIGVNATPGSYVVRGRCGGQMAPIQALASTWAGRLDGGPIDVWTDEITVPSTGTTANKTVTLDVQFYEEHDGTTTYPAAFQSFWQLPDLAVGFVISAPA